MKNRTQLSNKFGIIPIPIYIKKNECKSSCIYCPDYSDLPKSYLPNEDTIRAKKLNYDPVQQIRYWINRIRQKFSCHKPIKLEIIILGGTFSDIDNEYRLEFFKSLYDSLNENSSKSLIEAQHFNEVSNFRACVITVESRPDSITKEECNFLLNLGISKVELGIQSIYNHILEFIGRPYDLSDIKHANLTLKKFGFKVGYHIMINLPLSNLDLDTRMLIEINSNPMLMPDFVKIYPLSLVKDKYAQKIMWDLYEKERWKPYSFDELIKILYEFKKNVSPSIRIQRIQRQFNGRDYFYSKISIRDKLKEVLIKDHANCKCIRCEELKTYNSNLVLINSDEIKLFSNKIDNNNYFITIYFHNFLIAYARLFLKNNFAIIREIKTVGKSSFVHEKSNIQGRGFGSYVLNETEKIVKSIGLKKIHAVASFGVRGFFKKNNYFEEGPYMSKIL